MNFNFFHSFARLLEMMPPSAIFKVCERQARMLAEDVACRRLGSTQDTESILDFYRFLESSRSGKKFSPAHPLPLTHVAFYRKTLDRLISVGQLKPDVKTRFDEMFWNANLPSHFSN